MVNACFHGDGSFLFHGVIKSFLRLFLVTCVNDKSHSKVKEPIGVPFWMLLNN